MQKPHEIIMIQQCLFFQQREVDIKNYYKMLMIWYHQYEEYNTVQWNNNETKKEC